MGQLDMMIILKYRKYLLSMEILNLIKQEMGYNNQVKLQHIFLLSQF